MSLLFSIISIGVLAAMLGSPAAAEASPSKEAVETCRNHVQWRHVSIARESCSEALKAASNQSQKVETLFLRAQAYRAGHRYLDAQRDLRRIVAVGGREDAARAFVELFHIEVDRNNFADALTLIDSYIDEYGESAWILHVRARAWVGLKKFEKAAADLENGLAMAESFCAKEKDGQEPIFETVCLKMFAAPLKNYAAILKTERAFHGAYGAL